MAALLQRNNAYLQHNMVLRRDQTTNTDIAAAW
jgi:hypothetical protein